MTDIVLEVAGERYSFWKQMNVTRSLETFSGAFSFVVSGGIHKDYPIKVGQTCRIMIDQHSILNGYIEQINGNLDMNTDEITISGRDKTLDIIDSTIGENININSPTTLTKLIKKVLSILNITDINIIEASGINTKYNELLTVEPGTTAFEYLQKYAKKSQVLLTTDGNGNIVFTRASNTKLKTLLSTNPGTPAHIKSRTFNIDYTKRFNKYILKNQNNDSTGVFFTALEKKATDDSDTAFDKEIRSSRQLYEVNDYSAIESGELKNRAQWEANFRRSQSFTYTCQVQGFYAEDDNILWQPNMLVKLQDNEANINSTLLISEVNYMLTIDEGSITNLKLVTKDAFTLLVNRPDKDKSEQPESNIFFTALQRQQQQGQTG